MLIQDMLREMFDLHNNNKFRQNEILFLSIIFNKHIIPCKCINIKEIWKQWIKKIICPIELNFSMDVNKTIFCSDIVSIL
jgi:hypothetical protein